MDVTIEFSELLQATEIMRQVARSMKEEPLKLLADICNKNESTGRPVPDHSLHMQGYIGDVALKALIESGMLTRKDGGKISLYTYQPTRLGLDYYGKLKLADIIKPRKLGMG